MTKATITGLTFALALIAGTLPAGAATMRLADVQPALATNGTFAGFHKIIQVQTSNGQLVPKSVAARAARRYSGGQVLGIRLRNGSRPVWVVKVKTRGKIRRVQVDARNGRVIGRP